MEMFCTEHLPILTFLAQAQTLTERNEPFKKKKVFSIFYKCLSALHPTLPRFKKKEKKRVPKVTGQSLEWPRQIIETL